MIHLIECDQGEIATRELRTGIRASSRPSVDRRSISWEQAACTVPEHGQVIIVLPADMALIAEASLPPASLAALRAAVNLQLERHVPFRPDDAYFDVFRPPNSASDERVLSQIGVLPRKKLDPILQSIRERKLRIREVRLRLANGTLDDRFNFRWSLPRARTSFDREQLAAMMLALTLSIIAGWTIERRWDNEREALETTIESSVTHAALARKLDQEIADAERRVAAMRGMDNALTTLELFEDLAERLPDGSWLEAVSFKPDQLVLAGYCQDTGEIATLLEASPYLRDIALGDLSLSTSAGAVERFEIRSVPGSSR